MKAFFALLFIAAFLIAGCSQSQPAAQGTVREIAPGNPVQTQPAAPSQKEFQMTISHTSYQPDTIEVNKGDTVKIDAVTSPRTANHNHGITIDAYGINQAVLTEDTAKPQVITFIADKAGEFDIYCKTCWDGPFGRDHPEIHAKLIVKG